MKPADDFVATLKTPMSAKRLILLLFGALDDVTLPISKLIVGGSVFGIEDSAIRVAANRLANEGVLHPPERGQYEIGEKGEPLYEASRAWQRQNERVSDWDGGWFCVHVAHLGRSDRKALRARQRAFVLCGFAELEDGLWVRPDNLSLSIESLADELFKLGLDPRAVLFQAVDLVQQHASKMHDLWDKRGLEANYHAALKAMAKSEAKLASKPSASAAREVLEIGSTVVSVLTLDPLLPDTFVDTALRQRVYDAMVRYDEFGKSIWEALFSDAEDTTTGSSARPVEA